MRRKPGNWRACTDAETCEANVPTLGGNYQGGEGPLEQRRTSGGNGGVDAAHLPLGMSARGGANSPRVVYASGAENLGPPKANGHYHPSQAFLRWSSAAPAVPRPPCALVARLERLEFRAAVFRKLKTRFANLRRLRPHHVGRTSHGDRQAHALPDRKSTR